MKVKTDVVSFSRFLKVSRYVLWVGQGQAKSSFHIGFADKVRVSGSFPVTLA